MLPEFTGEGDLPAGVHLADWPEFQSRFGTSTARRVWLLQQLRRLLALVGGTGKLQRVFVWGSFVTAKPATGDLDVLLIMKEDFEIESVAGPARDAFNSVRARLLFESDLFWARVSIGDEVLQLWLDTYQISKSFRRRGIVELETP